MLQRVRTGTAVDSTEASAHRGVGTSLQAAHDQLGAVQNRIADLRNQLSPIMRSLPPSTATLREDGRDKQPRSTIGEGVAELYERLRNVEADVCEIIAALDI